MRVMAIDPGSARSAFVVLDASGIPAAHRIEPNEELLIRLRGGPAGIEPPAPVELDAVAIEWMTPRGMPTSAEEFETLWWAGRFTEALAHGAATKRVPVVRVSRLAVKRHVCGNVRANDTNIRAALIDRYGGTAGKEAAIGRKATPGPLYGLANDEWAALAVAVTHYDQEVENHASR